MNAATDTTITTLDWALAATALSLWCASYGLTLWREPAIRRWFDFRWAQIAARAEDRRRRSAARRPRTPAKASVRPLFPAVGQRPRNPPLGQAIVTQAIRTTMQEQPAIRLAEWSVDHLPLRYRLLGRPRGAVNDN